MKQSLNLYYVLLMFILTASAWAAPAYKSPAHCDENTRLTIKTSIKDDKNSTHRKAAACSDLNRSYALVSTRCAANLDQCLKPIFQRSNARAWKFKSEFGNPGFHFCYFIGGDPEFVEYAMTDGTKQQTSVCFLNANTLFVDIDNLVGALRRISDPK